ncbi:hypothetical protein GOBAR_AA06222 [Gossypium barbadense]|uniref:Uncharacterized protein n=1 Tax=Gossypium barbadense TaxID=3634 RepID=A0A2P5YFN1_GOSBA|nr:hypothetical protein GOBAR_AA06222 [Gossypium barbadense]
MALVILVFSLMAARSLRPVVADDVLFPEQIDKATTSGELKSTQKPVKSSSAYQFERALFPAGAHEYKQIDSEWKRGAHALANYGV